MNRTQRAKIRNLRAMQNEAKSLRNERIASGFTQFCDTKRTVVAEKELRDKIRDYKCQIKLEKELALA